MKTKWVQLGEKLLLREVGSDIDQLKGGIYRLMASQELGLFLVPLQERFEFPYKVYGIQSKFISRVKKTYEQTTGNLGILLNGIKGTGKTVTGELLCNEMRMPVILVNSNYGQAFSDFVNAITQDIVIYCDEYEKNFSKKRNDGEETTDHSILAVMDGVLSNKHRRIFLLTTNEKYVESNLMQRPGRIRYLKTFSDLDKETIEEIVDDCLIHKDLKEAVIRCIRQLEIITIDIVKAIVSEVNIHKEDPETFINDFNIEKARVAYKVSIKREGKWEIVEAAADSVYPSPIETHLHNRKVGYRVNIEGENFGVVHEVKSDTVLLVRPIEYNDYFTERENESKEPVEVKIEKTDPIHASYYSY
jgi:hypothetical protein